MTAAESDAPRETHELPITTRTLHRERVKVSQHVAAAIAHELRTPVFGIAAAAQLLRYRNADDPLIERNLGRILRDTERLNVLIDALLEFGRPDPVRLESGDPDDVWSTVLDRHRGLLESKALLVQRTPAPGNARFAIDREQLAQALENALVNAIEAAPEGTDLSIASSITRDGAWQSRLRNAGAPIDPAVRSRLFEPLVSNKPGHVGIGLAVAHRIVSEHGGSIAVETEDGVTTLVFTLPAVPAFATPHTGAAVSGRLP